MWKFIMNYYGYQCYKRVKKKQAIDNIDIIFWMSILFSILNFQFIFYVIILIIEFAIPKSQLLNFYLDNIYFFLKIFGLVYAMFFFGFYFYVEKNKIHEKINPYDYKNKATFFSWYETISGILLFIVGLIIGYLINPTFFMKTMLPFL